MKPIHLLIATLSIVAISACTSGDKSAVKEEVSEATMRTGEDYGERKTEFINQSERRISDIETDIKDLESAQLRNPTESTQEEANTALDEANEALQAAQSELEDLREADPQNWEEEQTDFLSNMNRLEERFAKARGYYETF